eukprot:8116807-Lingulodinium_polyedra.AAC.1
MPRIAQSAGRPWAFSGHRHGQSESMNVMSADLRGPHAESYGTKFKCFMVAVYKAGPGAKNLPFVR